MPTIDLPSNIPWQHIGVVQDMMDDKFCNNKFPYTWRSSLAIFAHEPKSDELPEDFCGKLTYIKVCATITGYQPTDEEIEAAYDDIITFPNTPTEEDIEHLFDDYFGCYGALLNVSVHPNSKSVWKLQDYPKIHGFEPKNRELIQTSTESGSILTKSGGTVATDQSLSSTKTSNVGFTGKSSATISAKVPNTPFDISGTSEKEANVSWSNSLEDTASTSTTNSIERQETQGSTTNISQLYNLLSGYHCGTNRAAFLMLARPHVLQATNKRTFVQGLRHIEGVQEFFMAVVRPKDMEGLCIEARLDTGHFPETVEIIMPEPKYKETYFDFNVSKFAKQGTPFNPQTVAIDTTYTLPSGWVVDTRTPHKGDTGHIGIQEFHNHGGTPNSYNYQAVNDNTVKVSGTITGRTWWRGNEHFNRTFRVFARSAKEIITDEQPKARIDEMIVTSRNLCACFVSNEPCLKLLKLIPSAPIGDIPFPFPLDGIIKSNIIDERSIYLPKDLIDENLNRENFENGLLTLLEKIKTGLVASSRKNIKDDAISFTYSDYYFSRLLKKVEESLLKSEEFEHLKDKKKFNNSLLEFLTRLNSKSKLLKADKKLELLELRKTIYNRLKEKYSC